MALKCFEKLNVPSGPLSCASALNLFRMNMVKFASEQVVHRGAVYPGFCSITIIPRWPWHASQSQGYPSKR